MSHNVMLACMLLGSLFIFIGGLGVLRFPDIFCRSHALTKAMTLGITLIAAAGVIGFSDGELRVKLIIAIMFQYTTIPLAGHILGLVAFKKNVTRWKHRAVDMPD